LPVKVRWRQASAWDRIIDALAAGQHAAVQMIDTSVPSTMARRSGTLRG
jgi:ABC-type nitrate/sulfonate/bicarbonate transport system substrate-binding protein